MSDLSLLSGEDRKSRAEGQNDANDPTRTLGRGVEARLLALFHSLHRDKVLGF